MTADQAATRQATQESKANKALQLLEALSIRHAYIEVDEFTIGREEAEIVGGGGVDMMWVTTKYVAGRSDEREAFDTLEEAIAKAIGVQS